MQFRSGFGSARGSWFCLARSHFYEVWGYFVDRHDGTSLASTDCLTVTFCCRIAVVVLAVYSLLATLTWRLINRQIDEKVQVPLAGNRSPFDSVDNRRKVFRRDNPV